MHRNGFPNYLFRACCLACAIAITTIGTGLRASAQAASKDPSFEVATVKPVIMDRSHPYNPGHFGPHVHPASASYGFMSVESLIGYAYDLEPNQVTGPEWTTADHFDIEARFPDGADQKDDGKMLQSLLKDRFKLTFHIERRDLESYVLVVGKHGAKLEPSPPDPSGPETGAPSKPADSKIGDGSGKVKLTKDGSSTVNMGQRGALTVKFDRESWSNHMEYSKMTMEDLAKRSSGCLGTGYHKVVDETGIKGSYQVTYDCPLPGHRPQLGTDAAGVFPPDPQDSSLLNRSLDVLGLKLEKRKVLMDVYVIDHVERPSAD